MSNTTDEMAALMAKFLISTPAISKELKKYLEECPRSSQQRFIELVMKHGETTNLNSLLLQDFKDDDSWKFLTLKDAFEERPPIPYIVDGLIPLPSLSVVYGAPGDLKSMLLADLLMCVSAGLDWLPPLPNSNGVKPISTTQFPVLWIDFDNGIRVTKDRIAALAKARNLSLDCPVNFVSMPYPTLSLKNKDEVNKLAKRLAGSNIKLCVIDNLSITSGVSDENSSEMGIAMSNLRRLAEDLYVAIVLIHHQRKSNGQGGRPGDSLRGSSTIEASLDLSLNVKRQEDSNDIAVKAVKVRFSDVKPFGARFSYTHKEGTHDLETARFYGIDATDILMENNSQKKENKFPDIEARELIIGIVKEKPKINQGGLIDEVKSTYPKAGNKLIVNKIEEMEENGDLSSQTGPRNSKQYTANA